MLKQTRNTNNTELCITLHQNCKNVGHTKLPSILYKNAKTTTVSLQSVLSKDSPAKFHLSATFGLSFMIKSVAPTRSSTFYVYLITKIGKRNLKIIRTEFSKILFTFLVPKRLDVPWKILDLTGRSKRSSGFLFISQSGAM